MTGSGAPTWADPATAAALAGRAQCAAQRGTGQRLRLDDEDLTAIAAHLRRTPSQERSRAKVALILQTAATLQNYGHQLTTTLLADCAEISIGSLYQSFNDVDAIMRCIATLGMRRALAELERTSTSGLAHLLTVHLTEYRATEYRRTRYCLREQDRGVPPSRADAVRAERARLRQEWCAELAHTLRTPSDPTADAPNAPLRQQPPGRDHGTPTVDVRAMVAVALADRAAALAVRGGAAPDRAAYEMTRAAQLYIDAAGLSVPSASATPHEAQRPGLPRRDRCALHRAPIGQTRSHKAIAVRDRAVRPMMVRQSEEMAP